MKPSWMSARESRPHAANASAMPLPASAGAPAWPAATFGSWLSTSTPIHGLLLTVPVCTPLYAIRRPSYGRSLIADPWGIVLAQAPDADGVITAELDAARLEDVRARLPSLASRRPEAYRRPAPV